MTTHSGHEGSYRLRNLIHLLLVKRLTLAEFCKTFEIEYNEAIDDGTIDPGDGRALSRLFDTVVWYTPFSHERAEVPHYIGDDVAMDAIASVAKELGINA